MSANKFTQTVVSVMRTLYPEELADKAWDNVGLLLDNTQQENDRRRHRVLLTNDLTPDVVDEAVSYQASVVIAYHPIIFRGLKSITLADAQQGSLIRLAQNNIAVYCPHTALDAGVDGINDWLASIVHEAAVERGCPNTSTVVAKSNLHALPESMRKFDSDGMPLDVGYGRITSLYRLVPAAALIRSVVRKMGLDMSHVLVARPRSAARRPAGNDDGISSVGVCAGSGFDVLRGHLDRIKMLVTGEVSHHDALYATTRGVWVVCLLHSNSERRFLTARLQSQLTKAITRCASYEDTAVLVSERDRDPFEFWDLDNPPQQPASRPEAFTV